MAKTYLQSGDEFKNQLNRIKRIVFIEGVFMGADNKHIDNIYHVKDLSTGKITHVRNKFFETKKYWKVCK